MNAWLLTWEGTIGPALDPHRKLISILSGRKTESTVLEHVDQLYCRSIYAAKDLAHFANKRREREAEFKHLASAWDRLFYGRNPCIFARLVSGLSFTYDPDTNEETLRWVDPPYLRVLELGAMPVEIEPATERELTRRAEPLARDLQP